MHGPASSTETVSCVLQPFSVTITAAPLLPASLAFSKLQEGSYGLLILPVLRNCFQCHWISHLKSTHKKEKTRNGKKTKEETKNAVSDAAKFDPLGKCPVPENKPNQNNPTQRKKTFIIPQIRSQNVGEAMLLLRAQAAVSWEEQGSG